MNLKFLGTMDLNKEGPIAIIMKFAAIAQKEYAIKCTLDTIDFEIDNCFLTFVEYGETKTYVFDDVDSDLLLIRDNQMKLKAVE